MATTPTADTPIPATLIGGAPRPEKSRAALVANAFWAILLRDMVVTGRDFIPFLAQTLLQPLFFLFIFGKVLPSIGFARPGFSSVLLPGIVALTVVTAALQGVTLPLVLDLGFGREIDDRLLAPLHVSLVALEKVVFAAVRGLIAGAVIFPLAAWILGSGYNVRGDRILVLIGVMLLAAFAGACLGIFIGTSIKPEQIGLMFALIFTPLIFTGCTYYPWGSLDSLKWFQVITLFNPLTYAAEGLRYAMVPNLPGPHGVSVPFPTLALGWVFLGLAVTIAVFFFLGIRTFRRRVIS
jgi:ABC-2 type transport system permease protein